MLKVQTYLAPSHGLGVFAGEDIPRGAVVWELDPRLDRLLEEMPAEEPERGFVYKYGYRDRHTGLIVVCLDNARFMNHADEPNTTPVPANGHAYGADVATRDIRKGEEITCNYRVIHAGE